MMRLAPLAITCLLALQLGFGPVMPALATSQVPQSIVPPASGRLGVETRPLSASGGINFLSETQTSWTRRNAVRWSEVEPVEGARLWSSPGFAALEPELAGAAQAGLKVILIVRGTPAWARQYPDSGCGPIRADKLAAFGRFMHDLVARLSRPPYSVKHWEIWNEPDIAVMPDDDEVGCWGDPADPYYGGGQYAAMLAAIHPQVKSADPDSKVLLGGLALTCDPRLPENTDCVSGRFLEGVLRAGGASAFDGVSFHAYDYVKDFGKYANEKWAATHDTTGAVVHNVARYIRELLRTYGADGKPLYLTEAGLVCYLCGNTGNADYETTKAYYVAHTLAAALAEGVDAALWYNLRDNSPASLSFGTGLRDYFLNERPSFDAYATVTKELNRAAFVRMVTTYPGVKIYEFLRDDAVVWLMWSADGATRQVVLPSQPVRLRMVFGWTVPTSSVVEVAYVPWFAEFRRPTSRLYVPIIRR